MKVLAWMPTAYILFVLLFLRFLPSKGETVGPNITAPDNGKITFDGTPGDNLATGFATLSTNLENPSVTDLNGSPEELCGQLPEREPPDLVVIMKKETGGGKGLEEEPNFELGKDGEANKVGDEDGLTIICTADYPVYIEFQVNDGYFTYFFNAEEKQCKCEPEVCNPCFQLGIRFPVKIWNSLKKTELAFTCRSISGRAVMQKKAVMTRSANSTHHMEILTISTEELDTTLPETMPTNSNGCASIRIGNCQLLNHGDHGFLREVSEKIPACKDRHNMEKGIKPCLMAVNHLVQLTGINDNSFGNTNPSPFLDMDILEKMICNFGSRSLYNESTEKNGYTCDFGGGKNQTKTEETSPCCSDCVAGLLIFSFLIMLPMCWVIFLRPFCCTEDYTLPTTLRMDLADDDVARASSMHVKWKVRRIVLVR
ncbi:unnamed protein product [Orchesella dallaii]|uniref:Uncharacterized protein n=1 Tax=Orchesella dallaii TaxID=48710 RepID=A0ABP1Q1J4_9HEXA